MFSGFSLTRRGRIVFTFLAVALAVAAIYGIALVTSIPPVPVSDDAWQGGLDAARARMAR